jgi:hypothetical protein
MPVRDRNAGEIDVPAGHPVYNGSRYYPLCHDPDCQAAQCLPDSRFMNYSYRGAYPCPHGGTPPHESEPPTGEDLEPLPAFDPAEEPPTGRHWVRAGVELEGGWNKPRRSLERVFGRKGQIKGDGSVSVNAAGHIGEFSTRPYKSEEALKATVFQAYPDAVNDTCGMHVHTSWTLGDYVKLADPRFAPFFRDKMAEFAGTLPRSRARTALETRLAGQNHFCQVNQATDGARHLEQQNVDRYRQLNYCWYRHNTLECRLLPMFDTKEGAWAAIRKLLNIYEEWLNGYGDLPDVAGIEFKESENVDDVIRRDISGRGGDDRLDFEAFTLDTTEEVDGVDVAGSDLVVLDSWPEEVLAHLIQQRFDAKSTEMAKSIVRARRA